MKKLIIIAVVLFAIVTTQNAFAQMPETNLVHITKLKLKHPENGNPAERDSLISIYVKNVIMKNPHILSHREYAHFFTDDNRDYLIIEEFKDFDSWMKANDMMEELEKAAWPDEKKRKEFLDSMNRYFEDWHGDMLMRYNSKCSKN